jgi:hypothetical protein
MEADRPISEQRQPVYCMQHDWGNHTKALHPWALCVMLRLYLSKHYNY